MKFSHNFIPKNNNKRPKTIFGSFLVRFLSFFLSGLKDLSLCHKLWFFNPHIFTTQCLRPWIFQTMNFVSSNNLSLKYQKLTQSGCKDIRILIFGFVAKTQFLWQNVCQSRYTICLSVNSYVGSKVQSLTFHFHFLPNHMIECYERKSF